MPTPHTPHEDRFLAILQHAVQDVDVVQEISIPRKARKLDAVTRLDDAPELFGALGPWLRDRAVVFEHESKPLSTEAVASAAVGQTWLHWHRVRSDGRRSVPLRRAVEGTSRPPLGVIVADTVAHDPVGAVAGLRPGEWPGVWSTSHVDEGGLVVLDTSRLVGTPGLEFWAWLGRAPTPDEAAERYAHLIDNLALSTLARTRLTEAIMNEQIPATTAEQETNYQRVRREEREEGGRLSILGLLSRYAPERHAELREVRDLDVLQGALDEAIQKAMARK